jgi:hypothetical protein
MSNRAVLILALGILSIVSMCCYTGLVVYAAYHDCDPVSTKVSKKNFKYIHSQDSGEILLFYIPFFFYLYRPVSLHMAPLLLILLDTTTRSSVLILVQKYFTNFLLPLFMISYMTFRSKFAEYIERE